MHAPFPPLDPPGSSLNPRRIKRLMRWLSTPAVVRLEANRLRIPIVTDILVTFWRAKPKIIDDGNEAIWVMRNKAHPTICRPG